MVRLRVARILIASSAAFALVLAAGFALSAASVGHPTPPTEATSAVQRSVVWDPIPENGTSPRAFRLISTSVNAPHADQFKISYAGGGFRLEYQRVKGGPVTSDFNLTFRNLIEWNDTNGDGEVDEENILRVIPLGSLEFGRNPVVHQQWTAPDGSEVHSVSIVSNDGQQLALNLTIGERFLPLPDGNTLTPMEAKLTVEIRHTFAHPGARLGLQLGLETTAQVKLEDDSWDDDHGFSSDDRALNMTEDDEGVRSNTFFAWADLASVDGEDREVKLTGPETNSSYPNYYDLYLAYPGAELAPASIHVIHDPVIGVVSAAYESIVPTLPPLQPDYILYVGSAVAVAVLVMASVLFANRRRKM